MSGVKATASEQQALIAQLYNRFGAFEIHCFAPDAFRVSVHGWHLRDGASTSNPSAHGKSIDAALAHLVKNCSKRGVHLAEGGAYECGECREVDCDY